MSEDPIAAECAEVCDVAFQSLVVPVLEAAYGPSLSFKEEQATMPS